MSMATVRLISSLLAEMPPTDASALVRAAWFDRKADAFDRVASEDQALAQEAADLADGARAAAARLRAEAGDSPCR
jgi:hypothetical protein